MVGEPVGQPIEILLVEDNPGDVRLTQVALQEAKVQNNLTTVNSGEKALAVLFNQGEYAGSPRPDIVLLDLNLPGMDGRELLDKIKSNPDLMRIPVVILTTSKAQEDILKSYNLHANAYITKPVSLDRFLEVVRTLESFWFTIVKLPPRQI